MTHSDRVATVSLNNEQERNRLTGTMREDLLDALRAVCSSRDTRCITITGIGPDFCGGADIQEMAALHQARDVGEVRRRISLGGEIVATIQHASQPVIAALKGLVGGAGVGLALACDVRLGADTTAFVPGFVRLGLLPDWGSIDGLAEIVGRGSAADVLLTGDLVDAQRAYAIGLIQHLYAAERLESAVASYATRLAATPQAAVAAVKERLHSTTRVVDIPLTDFELDRQASLFLSPECGEALERYAGKVR